uniref:VPS9 domain-containing protein n=1 Tax=Vannella robusta TaxID=1487602 RepID=A0A6U1X0T1_9EUKA
MLSKADQKIESYKADLTVLYRRIVSELEPELHIIARKHKTRIEYEENGKSWIRNVIDNLKSNEASPFEEELYNTIMSHFASTFSREFADWITSVRLQFSKEILTEANGIQESVNSLRKELTKSDVTVEMDALLQQTEKHIGNMIAAQMSIAGPVVGLLATGVGVGVGAPLILVGAVTGSIVTGGMLLLAGVAAAGLLSGLASFSYIQKINHRTESDVRELVFTNAMTQLTKWPSSPGYASFENKAVSSCVMVKELIQSTLMLSVVQVETLSKSIEVQSITYDDLCNFLYMRETLEAKIKDLCELMKQFDNKESLDLPSLFSQVQQAVTRKHAKHRGTFATSSTDELVGCHYPECVICKQEFIHCTHLCASCRVTLDRMGNFPCPTCNKGNHILIQNTPYLSTLENMFDMDEDDYVEVQDRAEDWLPFYANEKAKLLSKLKQKNKKIDYFVSWFNETFSGAHSSELITTRNIINCFVSTYITKLSPRNDVPELYRTLLTECLQEIIYPQIYDTLFTIYKHHFKQKDNQNVQVMERLANEGPSYYQNEIDWDETAVTNFSRAIECIRDFDRFPIPLMKLRSLVQCYKEFESSIPEDFAVGADLLVPTLVYFLVQSKVSHLNALFALVLDALDHTELMKPDEEYLFVTIHSLVLEFPKICVRYANESSIGNEPLRMAE